MDPARRKVLVSGRDVELTTNEFQLLYVLLANAWIVFSRDALLNKVWKDEAFVTSRSVDTLVKRLRKKIEINRAEPSVILTVWGGGLQGGGCLTFAGTAAFTGALASGSLPSLP